jgi:succinate dehydrogenase hydrophobic anchor subunit
MTLFAIPGGFEWVLFTGLILLYFFSFFILFTNIWQRNDVPINTKLGWSIFFVVAPIIALLIYLMFGRKQMNN